MTGLFGASSGALSVVRPGMLPLFSIGLVGRDLSDPESDIVIQNPFLNGTFAGRGGGGGGGVCVLGGGDGGSGGSGCPGSVI